MLYNVCKKLVLTQTIQTVNYQSHPSIHRPQRHCPHHYRYVTHRNGPRWLPHPRTPRPS